MDNSQIKSKIETILKQDDRLWNEDKSELNQTLLLDLVDKTDENIIILLLQDNNLREKFFIKIKDVYVFKTNDFKFFMEEHKVDNSFTQYKNKIGLTDGKRFIRDTNDVVLDFPYKDCVLEGGQSTEEGVDTYFEYSEKNSEYEKKQAKRKEIFFNQILAKDEIDRLFDEKALVNWKRFTKDGDQEVKEIKRDENGIIRENMIIKGNNLLALHSLKKEFAGKIKLIYIDPPYNTGKDDFKYNDNFTHSTWLTFMKNRLEIARYLLRADGSIWINIDEGEAHYLKILCDEIFGRDNFITNIAWQRSYAPVNLNKYFSKNFDFILVYTKNIKEFSINKLDRSKEQLGDYKNRDNDPRGPWKLGNPSVGPAVKENIYKITTPSGRELFPPKGRSWLYSRKKFEELLNDNRIWFGKNGTSMWGPKLFLNEVSKGITPQTLWTYKEVGHTQDARKEILSLFNNMPEDFPTSKPEKLIMRIIHIGSNKGDLVLDFYSGSGTTMAVAHKMERQYIGIEQMDYVEKVTLQRIKKVIGKKEKNDDSKKNIYDEGGISKIVNWQGGGDFIYFELAKWNEKAKEEILACNSLEDLEILFDTLYEKYFLNYNLRIKEFKEKIIKEDNFRSLSLDEQKEMFLTMLDLNQMYIQKSEMTDKRFGISEKDRDLTTNFYNI
jgi:adenine-specific DNA-methyltransferase